MVTPDNGYRNFGEGFDKYMKSIENITRISTEEEINLSVIIKANKNKKEVRDAIDKLVVSNLLLVVKFAINYYQSVGKGEFEISIMDLISQGNIGLFKAASSFNSDKGKFSTYASHYIKRYIQNERYESRFIRLPINYYTIINAVKKKMNDIPNDEKISDEMLEEIAKKQDSNLNHVKFVMECYEKNILSIEQPIDSPSCNEDDNNGILDIYPSSDKSLNDLISEKEGREYLFKKIDTLSNPEQKIIFAKYFDGEEVTCKDLAGAWGVSKQRVSQILISALKKLKYKILEDRINGKENM